MGLSQELVFGGRSSIEGFTAPSPSAPGVTASKSTRCPDLWFQMPDAPTHGPPRTQKEDTKAAVPPTKVPTTGEMGPCFLRPKVEMGILDSQEVTAKGRVSGKQVGGRSALVGTKEASSRIELLQLCRGRESHQPLRGFEGFSQGLEHRHSALGPIEAPMRGQ